MGYDQLLLQAAQIHDIYFLVHSQNQKLMQSCNHLLLHY